MMKRDLSTGIFVLIRNFQIFAKRFKIVGDAQKIKHCTNVQKDRISGILF